MAAGGLRDHAGGDDAREERRRRDARPHRGADRSARGDLRGDPRGSDRDRAPRRGSRASPRRAGWNAVADAGDHGARGGDGRVRDGDGRREADTRPRHDLRGGHARVQWLHGPLAGSGRDAARRAAVQPVRRQRIPGHDPAALGARPGAAQLHAQHAGSDAVDVPDGVSLADVREHLRDLPVRAEPASPRLLQVRRGR